MPSELADKVQRWTAKRRAAVVLMILKGETSGQEVARKYGLRVVEVEEWRDQTNIQNRMFQALGRGSTFPSNLL